MKKKQSIRKDKRVEIIVVQKRVQTAEGRRRAMLRDLKASKSKAA